MEDVILNSVVTVFSTKWKTAFGEAVYLLGNTFDLGEWKLEHARKMSIRPTDQWSVSIRLPTNTKIEYKYFVSDFEGVNKDKIKWQHIEGNRVEQIMPLSNPPLPLSICSFNIRYLNKSDQGQTHWEKRKVRIVEYTRNRKFGILGVQEAVLPQREYLQNYLTDYKYYGRARDSKHGEECGIFVHKYYTVISDSYHWISETQEQGSIGYDARLPRYFTSLTVSQKYVCPVSKKVPVFIVINLHLDHEGELARRKGLEQVIAHCKSMRQKYRQNEQHRLVGCFVMGDFNQSETSSKFKVFKQDKVMPFISMREIKGADKSFTFNGFSNKYLLKIGEFILNDKLTIDHMFFWLQDKPYFTPAEFNVEKPESSKQILSDHYPIVGLFTCNSSM